LYKNGAKSGVSLPKEASIEVGACQVSPKVVLVIWYLLRIETLV
jgi:hypothetical protein